MLDVGWSELKKAFKSHSRFIENVNTPSHYLLLFYAVECGLKSKMLKRAKVNKISQFSEICITTHNLRDMIRYLKWSCSLSDENFNYGKKALAPIKQIHEAWRYGIKIHEEDESRIVNWLQKLKNKLKERL